MSDRWRYLPGLSGYTGPDAYRSLSIYVASLHRAAAMTVPPFDPLRIAQEIGVPVQVAPTYPGNRGLLVSLRNGTYRIIVQAGETSGAQRFTVAHELIELGLQLSCPDLVEHSTRDPSAERAKERFCEAGAAEILLPLTHLRRALADLTTPASIDALLPLSTQFGASLQATLRRLVDAASRPCLGLILCEYQRHPYSGGNSVPMSVSVQARQRALTGGLQVSMALSGGGLAVTIPRGVAISPHSLLARCHRDSSRLGGVEDLHIGPLRGRFRVEAVCPGQGWQRHVYALLHPCSTS